MTLIMAVFRIPREMPGSVRWIEKQHDILKGVDRLASQVP
jgi:hypothetical protein